MSTFLKKTLMTLTASITILGATACAPVGAVTVSAEPTATATVEAAPTPSTSPVAPLMDAKPAENPTHFADNTSIDLPERGVALVIGHHDGRVDLCLNVSKLDTCWEQEVTPRMYEKIQTTVVTALLIHDGKIVLNRETLDGMPVETENE